MVNRPYHPDRLQGVALLINVERPADTGRGRTMGFCNRLELGNYMASGYGPPPILPMFPGAPPAASRPRPLARRQSRLHVRCGVTHMAESSRMRAACCVLVLVLALLLASRPNRAANRSP